MKLKAKKVTLRQGWTAEITEEWFTVYKRLGADNVFAYAIIDLDDNIFAYPFGEFGWNSGHKCRTHEAAHAYLIEKGSESPWEAA